eukprot:TRINITY_DN11446_c0_g1_i1.p1 TRINITY_DN11446_c0_g1~~TRINITY_DN11446_c0_g1_i1.p1  ORF type:complete len:567 (-),score=93.96 TRINITY_DN11446_c0_g1_i1:43-1743(-)
MSSSRPKTNNDTINDLKDVFNGLSDSVICDAFEMANQDSIQTYKMLYQIHNNHSAIEELKHKAQEIRDTRLDMKCDNPITSDPAKPMDKSNEIHDNELPKRVYLDSSLIIQNYLDEEIPDRSPQNKKEYSDQRSIESATRSLAITTPEKLTLKNSYGKDRLRIESNSDNLIILWDLSQLPIPFNHIECCIGVYYVSRKSTDEQLCLFKLGGVVEGKQYVRIPHNAGSYYAKLYKNSSPNSYVFTSECVYVGPNVQLTICIDKDRINENREEFKIDAKLISGTLGSDCWFGLYSNTEGTSIQKYIEYQSLGREIVVEPGEPSQCIVKHFKSPRVPDSYIVKLLTMKNDTISTSNVVRIPSRDIIGIETVGIQGRLTKVKVNLKVYTIDISSKDHVVMYKINNDTDTTTTNTTTTITITDQHHTLITRKNITKDATDVVEFDAPNEVGRYYFVYSSSSWPKHYPQLRSDTFEIKNTDMLTVTKNDNKTIVVNHDIHSQTKSTWDWIGIFTDDETNMKNFKLFKYIELSSSKVTFDVSSLPTPGKYVARYFSSTVGKYLSYRSSIPFDL